MALEFNSHTSTALIGINIIGTVLLCFLLWNDILLRWHLSYYIFAIMDLTGIALLFIERKNIFRDFGKVYGISWCFIAVIGLLGYIHLLYVILEITLWESLHKLSDSYYDNLRAIKEYAERHNIFYHKLQWKLRI